jgi:tRNA threonylcarbamoyladenosine biosynthesis protein TsaE
MQVSLTDLPAVAEHLLQTLPTKESAVVVALRGDLGAGKTTLVQALARTLGVVDPVLSPTYVLMRSYTLPAGQFAKLVHIDAYRFDAPEQWEQLKPQEFLGDPATLVLVEWPEKVEGFMPKPDLVVDIKQGTSDTERDIVIQA